VDSLITQDSLNSCGDVMLLRVYGEDLAAAASASSFLISSTSLRSLE